MHRRGARLFAVCALIVVLAPSTADAHGELEKSEPQAGSRLNQAPPRVSVTLTEAPSDARLRVRDGCGRQVSKTTTVDGRRIVARILHSARPGRWVVRFQAVSSEDDHITDESFSFTVRGRRDCNEGEEPTPSPSPSESATPTGDSTPGSSNGGPRASGDEESSGIPPAGIVLGAGVLVAAGLGLRRLLSR